MSRADADRHFRVWYGNGQVSDTMTRAEAERHLADCQGAAYGGYARLSRYEGDGDWSIRTKNGEWRLLV